MDLALFIAFFLVVIGFSLWKSGAGATVDVDRAGYFLAGNGFRIGPLAPRTRTITLRLDNRIGEINPGPLSHSVTDHTQGNWNGVVGRIELRRPPANRIERVDVFPSNNGRVRLAITGTGTGSGVSIRILTRPKSTPAISRRATSRSSARPPVATGCSIRRPIF